MSDLLHVKEDIARLSSDLDEAVDKVNNLAYVTFENQKELADAYNIMSDRIAELSNRVSKLDGIKSYGKHRRVGRNKGKDFRDFWLEVARIVGYR
jgi:RNA recognition motif-containing protein